MLFSDTGTLFPPRVLKWTAVAGRTFQSLQLCVYVCVCVCVCIHSITLRCRTLLIFMVVSVLPGCVHGCEPGNTLTTMNTTWQHTHNHEHNLATHSQPWTQPGNTLTTWQHTQDHERNLATHTTWQHTQDHEHNLATHSQPGNTLRTMNTSWQHNINTGSHTHSVFTKETLTRLGGNDLRPPGSSVRDVYVSSYIVSLKSHLTSWPLPFDLGPSDQNWPGCSRLPVSGGRSVGVSAPASLNLHGAFCLMSDTFSPGSWSRQLETLHVGPDETIGRFAMTSHTCMSRWLWWSPDVSSACWIFLQYIFI